MIDGGESASDEDIDYVIREGVRDWIGMSTIVPIVLKRVGRQSSLAEKAQAVAELTGVLVDHGVLPGDLVAAPADFVPWAGSRRERMDRIAQEIIDLGRLPVSGEIAWFGSEDRRDERNGCSIMK